MNVRAISCLDVILVTRAASLFTSAAPQRYMVLVHIYMEFTIVTTQTSFAKVYHPEGNCAASFGPAGARPLSISGARVNTT